MAMDDHGHDVGASGDLTHPNAIGEAAAADESILGAPADGYYGEDSATLGDRLAAARLQAGLTQSGLAARIGVGAKVVSSWENDRSEPRANRLTMLSGLLGVSVSWLLTGGGEGVAPPGEPATVAPSESEGLTVAVPVRDLEAARRFYGDVLGCALEPMDGAAQPVRFFGSRLVLRPMEGEAVLDPVSEAEGRAAVAPKDDDGAPFAPLAVTLSWDAWTALIERLRASGAPFVWGPAIHGVGEPRERAGAVTADPEGGLIAFQAERRLDG